MATYGHTFTSGDTLTPTKLNAARTATDIVDADISSSAAIALSKLATGALPTAITVASANIVDGTIGNADISASAAIAHSKLANITSGQVLLGNASNVPTSSAVTGDVTISNTGVTAIGAGVIVNADINASAAIAATKLASNSITDTQISSAAAIDGTKIDPDFGALAVVTTGNVTANRLVAGTGSAAEASVTFTGDGDTGIFRPEANTLAFCEGGAEAMRINSSGLVGVATTDPQYRLDVNGVVNSASHYRVDGDQVVGARATGWAAPTGTDTRTTFATASVTLPQLAERVHALIDDLIAHGLIGPTAP